MAIILLISWECFEIGWHIFVSIYCWCNSICPWWCDVMMMWGPDIFMGNVHVIQFFVPIFRPSVQLIVSFHFGIRIKVISRPIPCFNFKCYYTSTNSRTTEVLQVRKNTESLTFLKNRLLSVTQKIDVECEMVVMSLIKHVRFPQASRTNWSSCL